MDMKFGLIFQKKTDWGGGGGVCGEGEEKKPPLFC